MLFQKLCQSALAVSLTTVLGSPLAMRESEGNSNSPWQAFTGILLPRLDKFILTDLLRQAGR